MSLKSIIDDESIRFAEERLKHLFAPTLKYMDTHRDRQILKGLVAELRSTRFASRLQGLHSRKGTSNARRHLNLGLQQYSQIRETSQMVRSYLTVLQQYRLTERVISARKESVKSQHQSTTQPHQSADIAHERAAIHIKVTHPSC